MVALRLMQLIALPATAYLLVWVRRGTSNYHDPMMDAAWELWDAEHGLVWRVQRGIPHYFDRKRLAAGERVDMTATVPPPPGFTQRIT